MIAAALLLAAAVAPARVQVSADEFGFALSRAWIRSGPAIVQLVNYGEDEHDLALRRAVPGARTLRLGKVRPGRSADLETRLAPGRYVLWCTLAGHEARGMHATLVVKR
jgi:hypothetical protein